MNVRRIWPLLGPPEGRARSTARAPLLVLAILLTAGVAACSPSVTDPTRSLAPSVSASGGSASPVSPSGSSDSVATPAVASEPTISPAPTSAPQPTPHRTPAPTFAPQPTPHRTPAPTFAPPLAWSGDQLPYETLARDATSFDVAAGNIGFVIVGMDGREAASWTSADGLTWLEHRTGITLAWPERAHFRAVAASPTAFVAVGSVGIFRSTDGKQWEQVVERQVADMSGGDVAWGRAGFVAMGPVGAADAAAWVSEDGRDWQPAPASSAFASFCLGKIAGGPLGYVAIGSDCGDQERPVVITSADGRAWDRASVQPSLAGKLLYRGGVAAGGPGWIAFGRFMPAGSSTWGTQIWVSSDGLAWRRTSFLRPVAPYVACPEQNSAEMVEIASFAGGYIGVGTSYCNNDPHGAAWGSPDGLAWQSLSNSTGGGFGYPMYAVAAAGDSLVIAGSTGYVDYLPYFQTAVLSTAP